MFLKTIFSALLFVLLVALVQAQRGRKISPEDYIDTYKNVAIVEMKRSGIPASITLAQGMHESDNGNSYLSAVGNNHFGIKCHKWTGKALYKDDDKKNECFRQYKSASESYLDHSNFILGGQRYSFLFEYKTTDYKSWARGLKKAGYATNPRYSELIIKIIEDYKLYELDKGGDIVRATKRVNQGGKVSKDDFVININPHPIHRRNDVEYVVAKSGDTFSKLSREMDMFEWELHRYNEIPADSALREGQILYLQPKCRRAEYGNDYHTVQPGETVHSISQLYAVKVKHIRRLNRMVESDEFSVGDTIYLRHKKPRN